MQSNPIGVIDQAAPPHPSLLEIQISKAGFGATLEVVESIGLWLTTLVLLSTSYGETQLGCVCLNIVNHDCDKKVMSG